MNKKGIIMNKKLLLIIPVVAVITLSSLIIFNRIIKKPNGIYVENVFNTDVLVLEKKNNNLLVEEHNTCKKFLIKDSRDYNKVKVGDELYANLYSTENKRTNKIDYMIILNPVEENY